MKTVTVSALFPQLPAKMAEQGATAQATNVASATARALRDILRRPGVKGKRIREARLYLTISNGDSPKKAKKDSQ